MNLLSSATTITQIVVPPLCGLVLDAFAGQHDAEEVPCRVLEAGAR